MGFIFLMEVTNGTFMLKMVKRLRDSLVNIQNLKKPDVIISV